MNSFNEREKGFEAKYQHDQEAQFKIRAIRNKLVGEWGASLIKPENEEIYVKEVRLSALEKPGDDDLIDKLLSDFESKNLGIKREEIIKKTGQVCIQIRDVQGVDDNPFDFETVKKNIEEKLNPKYEGRFKIMLVPNITNICYGRGVGYKIEEIVMPEEIQKISATKIRAKMRDEGKLK